MVNNKHNKLIALILSSIGTIFLIYYIIRASLDVVSSDYIRIVNTYIKDVTDLSYLLSWEGISRIPFAFLARYINVTFFKYSVHFDRILGLVGLFAFNFVVVKFILDTYSKYIVKMIMSIIVTFISFSLMTWEMILNGSGYAHFLMIGIIAVDFNLFSNIKKYFILMCILIIVGSLCFGGPYSVSFLCTIILFSVFEMLFYTFTERNKKKKADLFPKYILIVIISTICLMCFMKSNNTGETLVPVGFKDITLFELLTTHPTFPIKFLIKSLASSIIGVETYEYALAFNTINENVILFIGLIYVLIIILALIVLTMRERSNDKLNSEVFNLSIYKNCFQYLFVIYGAANYLLVFIARYKFVRDNYGMSSRYGLQYMFFTIGVILILSSYVDDIIYNKCYYIEGKKSNDKSADRNKKLSTSRIVVLCMSIISVGILWFGHITTSVDEIFKADYRKILYTELVKRAKDYTSFTDEELMNSFEYHRSPEHIKEALEILKEQRLNVFK